jgi:hypothetical protein
LRDIFLCYVSRLLLRQLDPFRPYRELSARALGSSSAHPGALRENTSGTWVEDFEV